jgi:hypothetical protein
MALCNPNENHKKSRNLKEFTEISYESGCNFLGKSFFSGKFGRDQ